MRILYTIDFKKDISSVRYYQRRLQDKKKIKPIWLLWRDKYILLDGAHRIVLEGQKYIYAFVIDER